MARKVLGVEANKGSGMCHLPE